MLGKFFIIHFDFYAFVCLNVPLLNKHFWNIFFLCTKNGVTDECEYVYKL
jgi:hypothetical protein